MWFFTRSTVVEAFSVGHPVSSSVSFSGQGLEDMQGNHQASQKKKKKKKKKNWRKTIREIKAKRKKMENSREFFETYETNLI